MTFCLPQWQKLGNYLLCLGFVLSSSPAPLKAQSLPNSSVCDSVGVLPSHSQPENHAQKNLSKGSSSSGSSATESELWWIKEQLDQFEENLLISWQTDLQQQRLDLIVDRQRWSRLDYLERYRFVHQFGNLARENHYSLRVFNQQQKCLVVYWCNFAVTPSQCEMKFESAAESRFQIYNPAPGEFDFDKQ